MRIDRETAVQLLQSGQVVGMPTETVYGLAASLTHPEAIQKIFALKGRPLKNPLIIHVAQATEVKGLAAGLPPFFEELAAHFWPGPLTLIVPIIEKEVPSLVRAGLPSAGFRVPEHLTTLSVLRETGPLVMPSANLSGKPSATRVTHVEEDFGIDFPVLEGGVCTRGVESTILLYQGERWRLARLGALAVADFEPILGYCPEVLQDVSSEQPLCPGQLYRHYAPQAQLFLGQPAMQASAEVVLGFRERDYPAARRVICLGSLQNAAEVAENLYHLLRQLDLEHIKSGWVDMDFPQEGLWQTIAERLHRASEK